MGCQGNKVQVAKPLHHVDSKGAILSVADRKARGMRAAEHHKTSIDALLHPRHAGATPYRILLGDVRFCPPHAQAAVVTGSCVWHA